MTCLTKATADSSDMLSRTLDIAVICILERIGAGVSVLGLFDEGRIEGWIDGRSLKVCPFSSCFRFITYVIMTIILIQLTR